MSEYKIMGADGGKGEVLHSWKSIANYLSRSVRTARRWEENEELPVRRHKHLKSNTVFAYTHELEQWLRQREQPNTKLASVNDNHCMTNNLPPIVEPARFWNGVINWFQ